MADQEGKRPVQATEPTERTSSTANTTRRTSASSMSITGATRDRNSQSRQVAGNTPSDGQPSNQQSQRVGQRPPRLDYGSFQQDVPRQTVMSPRAKRPAPKRNPSTSAPHRGQEFSVDDDPSEVTSDLKLARQQSRQDAQRERDRNTLRRQTTTLRRRTTAQIPSLAKVDSNESTEEVVASGNEAAAAAAAITNTLDNGEPSSEETLRGGEDERASVEEDDEDAGLSDAESFTLKDRQEAINETHPFGIRIWKPALYKKNRSVQRNAEGDIHSAPGGNVNRWLFIFNCLWTILFGWWLCLVAAAGGLVSMVLSMLRIPGCYEYGRVLINLANYLFYPFGKYLKLEHDQDYLDEDEGEGRSISEYERWQTGDLEEGRLFFGPLGINRSLIGRRRDDYQDLGEAEETDGLLGRQLRQFSTAQQAARTKTKKRLFGRGKWNLGRVVFFLSFYFLITPCLFIVSGICWFFVFSIPMAKVTLLLFYHLRRHPLALSFHTDSHYSRTQSIERGSSGSSILLCTYRAVGLKYWKYTVDGTNVLLINLLGLVVFVIFDYFVLYETLGIRIWFTSLGFVFLLALLSIIPLAYFIGQAVASISAQSSMGVGATINAFFSTVVEVFLYCVALKEGKGLLVEGSIIGSIFAGILFLPGLSMCFGALKRKTQRFNVRSAGVTSTMLLFAVIGAFGPTLFHQIFGGHQLRCFQCLDQEAPVPGAPRGTHKEDCRRCYYDQTVELHSPFYINIVRPYVWFATVCLFLSYMVGLMFTLRTHAAVIWNNEPDEKRENKIDPATGRFEHEGRRGSVTRQGHHDSSGASAPRSGSASLTRENIRDSQMYKRILHQSLKQADYSPKVDGVADGAAKGASSDVDTTARSRHEEIPYLVPPKSPENDRRPRIQGLSAEDNRALVQEIAEMAATAAAVAARDAVRAPRLASMMGTPGTGKDSKHTGTLSRTESRQPRDGYHSHKHTNEPNGQAEPDSAVDLSGSIHPPAHEPAAGGHDAPNWSRKKSAVILLTATVAYAVIAEILVDTVDAVLTNVDIDEKFLGITLFALVPNTTEFLNAISFAMNGNVALSMEIGSSYALQVMLLQIPCLVLFSAVYGQYIRVEDMAPFSFTLIFPQWDMITVILGVFLMGWVVGEGKSNYFKGSILIFTYLVVVVGFWFSSYSIVDTNTDGLALVRGTRGRVDTFQGLGQSTAGTTF